MLWAFRNTITLSILLAATLAVSQTSQTADVVVAIGAGQYAVYHSDGSFVRTIQTDPAGGQTGGCAFDGYLNLYATNVAAQQVVQVNQQNQLQQIVQLNNIPESISFDGNGRFYVAGPFPEVLQFQPQSSPDLDGAITYSGPTTIPTGSNTDWIDIGTNHNAIGSTNPYGLTAYFSSDSTQLSTSVLGSEISSVLGSALPNPAYAVRLLPPFDGTGGVLVADTTAVLCKSCGAGTKTSYNIPKGGFKDVRFLALAPDMKTFWAGDWQTGNVVQLRLSDGALLTTIVTPAKKSMGGLCVNSEPQLNVATLQFPTTSSPIKKTAQFGVAGTPGYNTWSVEFNKIVTPFTLVVGSLLGVNTARLTTLQSPSMYGPGTIEPITYDDGFPRTYHVDNPPAPSAYGDTLSVFVAYKPQSFTSSLSCLSPTLFPFGNPRLLRGNELPGAQFTSDFTVFVTIDPQAGDPISGGGKTFSDEAPVHRCAQIEPGVAGSAMATFNNPLPSTSPIKIGSVIPIKISVVDANGNPVTDAVSCSSTSANNMSITVTNLDLHMIESPLLNPGNAFPFWTFNGQSWSSNVDTSNFKPGNTQICVNSVSQTFNPATNSCSVAGDQSLPGQFPVVCTTVVLKR